MIELSFLGSPELRRKGDAVETVLVQPRRLALLAYLAVASGAFHRRDRLLLLFWGDQNEDRGRASLRQALHFIRRSLGDDIFVPRGADEIGLNREITRTDVAQVEAALTERRHEDALALYRGDFLADFYVDNAPEFERWAAERRREIRRSVLDASWNLADAALAASSRDLAVHHARRALDLADYSENDVRRAMRVMAAAGNRSAALEVYETFRVRLAADLEAEPESVTLELVSELRTRNIAGLPDALPNEAPPLVVATPVPVGGAASLPSSAHFKVKIAFAIVAAVVIAAISTLGTSIHRSVAAAADTGLATRVAVFPFTVRSRTAVDSYLRAGTATLLGLALDGAGNLRVVDPNAVLTASPEVIDVNAGRRLAQTLGAGKFVLGEIETAGTHLNIVATLYNAAGHVENRAAAVGEEAHIFDLVDSVARKMAVGAMTDSTIRLATVAATSTRSLGAFKMFLAGEAAMRSGHYRDAVAALQNAIAADSTFSLAYYRLSLAREWTDGEISSDSAAALAEHFASHLPARDRKLLAARRAFVRRDTEEGERLAREVVASYPTDADAWAQLGEMYFHLGPNSGRTIDEARTPFLTVLRYRPNDLSARVHLVRIAARIGDTTHLNQWSGGGTWLGDASEVGTFELAAMRAVVLGDLRARDTVIAAAKRANDVTVLAAVWRLRIYSGDPEAASKLARLRYDDSPQWSLEASLSDIARGHIGIGRTTDIELQKQHASFVSLMLAMPSAPDLPMLARNAHAELHRLVTARIGNASTIALLDERVLEARYPQLAVPSNDAQIPDRDDAKTTLAIANAIRTLAKDPVQAMALVAPERLHEPALIRLGLYDVVASIRAEAAHKLKHDEEAAAWLNSIGLNSQGSSASIPFARRRLAEIEEANGHHDLAITHWLQFIKQWNGSDEELQPLVDAARSHTRAN